jgi:archaemetzincin
MKLLQLVRIGEVEAAVLEQLGPRLAELFRVEWDVLPATLDPQQAYHAERQQYHSTELLGRMQALQGPQTWRLLGVSGADLYIPILTFVFGEAQLCGAAAVVSLHRLRQEFYGLPRDEELLRARLLKEAVHELGHTLDLRHCEDYQCAMAPSHAVEWIDLKDATFCAGCEERVIPRKKRMWGW